MPAFRKFFLIRVKTGGLNSCETGNVQTAVQSAASPSGRAGTAPEAFGSPTVQFKDKRLRREWKTMAAMVWRYCRDQHAAEHTLCDECRNLLDYATTRLDRCRFGPEKPTCANCPVHCYSPDRREQMKVVMRYAGPRMLWHHPILSLRHWLDGFRSPPKT